MDAGVIGTGWRTEFVPIPLHSTPCRRTELGLTADRIARPALSTGPHRACNQNKSEMNHGMAFLL